MAKKTEEKPQERFGVTKEDGTPLMKNDGVTPMTFNTKKAAQMEADRLGGEVAKAEANDE